MKRLYRYGGIAASVVLVAFGIGSIVVGANGRAEVRHDLSREQIVGTPDMEGVANKHITTGAMARKFAEGMRKHALEATGGKTYAQMPRYMGKDGKPTNDEKQAATDPKSGKPLDNPARNIWVTETALSTALNTSYFAENVANFAIVMGIALLLTGIGFGVLSVTVLGERPEESPARQPRATTRPALS
ncbi:MAG: hypothetical protein IRZ21_05950 [Thermoleophilaceae bacterium]|nr:hypothetical protein [Thermoleophilaceae bacterium]